MQLKAQSVTYYVALYEVVVVAISY